MASSWHQKKNKQADLDFENALQNSESRGVDDASKLITEASMGGGETNFFEKKMTKEEKKAAAKAKRDAKKKLKGGDEEEEVEVLKSASEVLAGAKETLSAGNIMAGNDGIDHEKSDQLASEGTICTFSASRKGVDARSRDINVQNFTLQHMGGVLLDECQMVLNHGNRYGLIGRNGCGKSTLLKALGARAVPIPNSIDIFFLSEEIEPSATLSALEAVMEVDEERLKLEKQAEELNHMLGVVAEDPDSLQQSSAGTAGESTTGTEKTPEELTEEIMDALNMVYERLDLLDASTAEVRARSILSGLGFTHEMQAKKTKEFSGGWRMRVSLARALFIQPVWYVVV
jgi:ATP-binding cassette subfamily F protein 2